MKRIGSLSIILVAVLAAPALQAAAPSGRYTVATHTVKDEKTGLTWQRTVSQYHSWAEAKLYCQGLTLGGLESGWRLPTRKELETLVDRRVANPSIDSTAFPDTQASYFWTSTPYAGPSPMLNAWFVNFYFGTSYYQQGILRLWVRCVH